MNPYLNAAYCGNLKLMKKLESEGQNIHIKSKYEGNNAYIYAIANGYGYIKILKHLESQGCNIHIKNNYGRNAYLEAAINGRIKIMKYLESKGININSKNIYNRGVYYCAVFYQNVKSQKYIIKNNRYKINKYNYIYINYNH